MASLQRLSCCRRTFFSFLLQPPFLILLVLSFSPLPVHDATRGLRLYTPPCAAATAFAAAAAVAAEGKRLTSTVLYSHAFHSLFFTPLCLLAGRVRPGMASRNSLPHFCASDMQCCTDVGCTAPSCFSLLVSPRVSQTSSLGCLALGTFSKSQHDGHRAAVRGSPLPQARVCKVSHVHSSASRVSFVFPHTWPPAAAATVFSFAGTPDSTASLLFPPAVSFAAPAPAVFLCTATASASATVSTPGRAAPPAASAACSAATTSCAPCFPGWNTYPAWLQGVWQVCFCCFLDEYAEKKTNEAEDAEDAEQDGQRRTLPPLTSIRASGRNMTSPSFSCAPRLTHGGDGTETQSVSISSMNGDEKTGDFTSLNVLPDACSVALDPREDLPVLLWAFCSTKRYSSSSSSSDETPINSVNGLGSSHSGRACCSRTDSYLSSSSSGQNSDSGSRPVASDGGVSISSYADTIGRTAATRSPSSRSSSSSTVTLHTSSTEVLKYGDDNRRDTAFHHSSSSTPDSAVPSDWRDFFSKDTRSICCRAGHPRRVAAALHLLTPLQRRSVVLLQETIGLYDVCLEPGGVLHFELPAAHRGRRSAAGTNAATAAAAPPERSTRTSYAGNPTEAGSAEEAHLNAHTMTLLHSRQPQVLLKKHQQQLEMWQQDEKQQQQQTRREAHILVAGKEPLQQQTLQDQQQPQASRRTEHGCEELPYFRQLLEEQEQHFEQQKSESPELSSREQQQHQHAQQQKRRALHHTCQPTPKAQQRSRPGQAFVQQLQQLEEPSTGNRETPSCKASVRGYSAGDEQQGPATLLGLLQRPLSRHVKSCAQDKIQRRKRPIEECVPLTWYFTPASRRLALLFWLPACKLMLRLSCEVRRRGPAACIYEKGPLCLPAAPLRVYLRDGQDAIRACGVTRGDAPCGAVAATSAAPCVEEAAAAGTQASSVEDRAEIRGNCAPASRVGCPMDRWAEWPQLCSTPVQEPAASLAAMGSASRSSPAAGGIKYWRRIPSGVWGGGFLYSCIFEGAECCDSMQRMRSLHRDRQRKPKNDPGGHLHRQQHKQQKRNRQQGTQSLPRRSQREQSLRETEELEDAQQRVQQQRHTQRQLVSQQEGLLRQRTQSRDMLPGEDHQVRPKSSVLLEQPQVCTAHTRVKKSDGMALLAEAYVHLKRPRLSRAATKPVSPALRPQQGFLTLRTGQQRHAFLQELRALQQVQLQYLGQFFFPHAVQRDQRVEVQQRHEQGQQQPEQKQLQPPPLREEEKRRWQSQLHAEQQRSLQIQLSEEQQLQRQQQEEYVRQQREGQQDQAKTLQQEAEHAEQQDHKKVLQQQEWQQPERGNQKKQYSPVQWQQQQLLWTDGESGLLQELSPDVTKDLFRSVKLLFVERERRWYAAGGLLERQRRRCTVKEKLAEVSRKSSFDSWAIRNEEAPERRVSVVSVALNGKVVGWTLPPPPFPVGVNDLLQHLTHAAAAKRATGAGLPALLSCEEEDTAGQEKAERGKGVAGAEDCAGADEEEQVVSPAERGRIEPKEAAKGAAVAADAILDDYAVLAGLQREEEAVAAGEGKARAAQKKRHIAAASAVLYKEFDESSRTVDTGRESSTPSAAPANGAQTRRKAARPATLDEADRVVSQLCAAATAAHERDTGAVERGQQSGATFMRENEGSTQKAACEKKQVGAAVCRGTNQAETSGRQEHWSAIAGEKGTNGAARGSKSASVTAVPTAHRAALGREEATICEAKIKQSVQQDVSAALLHPAVQRKLVSHLSCVKHVVYVHRTRLVNFVLQDPLLRNCSEEVP